MGYDELKEAREKRAKTEAKAAIKAQTKGKRGRKRASAALEADASKPARKAARVSQARKAPVPVNEGISRVLISDDVVASEQWRAPVARMF